MWWVAAMMEFSLVESIIWDSRVAKEGCYMQLSSALVTDTLTTITWQRKNEWKGWMQVDAGRGEKKPFIHNPYIQLLAIFTNPLDRIVIDNGTNPLKLFSFVTTIIVSYLISSYCKRFR
jgi:hypothetical protein